MDTPSRARQTSAQLTAGGESSAANAVVKPPARRLSADAVSSLSLEGSTSSSGSMGVTNAVAGAGGPPDVAAATASPHHQSESEFNTSLYPAHHRH